MCNPVENIDRKLPVRLVYVHGIGAPVKPAGMADKWSQALAVGMKAAGHQSLAEKLLDRSAVEPVMAHYADLYSMGAQGVAVAITEEEAALLLNLTAEIAARMTELRPGQRDQVVIEHVKAQLNPVGTPSGIGNVGQRAINAATTLMSVRPWAKAGDWISAKVMIRELRQVTRYMRRGEPDEAGSTLDKRIRERLADAIGTGPAVIVAHSLGSVVALETLHETRASIPLLVTFGSPLGMRTVVWPRLRPQPAATPGLVRQWLNIWDKDDVIVARSDLAADFMANRHGVKPESRRVDSDGSWVHPSSKYLRHPDLAGPVAGALREILD